MQMKLSVEVANCQIRHIEIGRACVSYRHDERTPLWRFENDIFIE